MDKLILRAKPRRDINSFADIFGQSLDQGRLQWLTKDFPSFLFGWGPVKILGFMKHSIKIWVCIVWDFVVLVQPVKLARKTTIYETYSSTCTVFNVYGYHKQLPNQATGSDLPKFYLRLSLCFILCGISCFLSVFDRTVP